MRLAILLGTVLLGNAPLALAQGNSHGGDLGLTYQWVHTNTQPGACGCFGLNGGGVSTSWVVTPRWSAAAEVSGGHESNGPATGNSLTLVSYLAGARYWIVSPGSHESRKLQPFLQVLVGAAHAGGGIAGAGDGTYAFASRVGGGVDLLMAPHLKWRVGQVDYYLTRFANNADNQQNNLLVASGLVLRWK